jgi:cathepsin B
MKSVLLILIAIASCNDLLAHRQKEIAARVNKLRTTWTATTYPRDFRPLIGTFLDDPNPAPEKTTFQTNDDDLPESFDSREKWSYCESLKEIRDQAKCGSCWAFGAAEVMSDRLCIVTQGKLQTRVSTTELVTCCSSCGYGCHGGYPLSAFRYWKSTGIPSGGLYNDNSTCKPYFLPPCDDHMHKCHDYVDTPECENKCNDQYPKTVDEDRTFGVDAYSLSGEKNLMKEIYENGPIEAAFTVYEDFGNYEKGIYQHVTGSSLGGHAIKIIGWGVENGVKYWLCANSWNESWGEKGYFRILKGENECGIERSGSAGNPKVSTGKKFLFE